MRVLVALSEPLASDLVDELRAEGDTVVGQLPATAITAELLAEADALVVHADRQTITAAFVAMCDRAGVRIVTVGQAETRRMSRYGLPAPLPDDVRAWDIVAALRDDRPATTAAPEPLHERIFTVWGPEGAPGRSTVAIQLAVELARTGRHTALVDADTVAPSLALLLGLSDDSPGLAAACRRAELGGLDSAELSRVATALDTSGGTVEVLAGLNRPSRWPELSTARVSATLTACRDWVDVTVVDVASSLERDAELTSDLPTPERHQATLAAVRSADRVIALTGADPLSVARFVRDYTELRGILGATPVTVVANRVRPGPLGMDARSQIRRTLERYCGIEDVSFFPHDARAADAALLHARPMADVTPRSALVQAVRRLATQLSGHAVAPTGDNSRENSRAARRLRPKRGVLAGSPRAGDPASAN